MFYQSRQLGARPRVSRPPPTPSWEAKVAEPRAPGTGPFFPQWPCRFINSPQMTFGPPRKRVLVVALPGNEKGKSLFVRPAVRLTLPGSETVIPMGAAGAWFRQFPNAPMFVTPPTTVFDRGRAPVPPTREPPKENRKNH